MATITERLASMQPIGIVLIEGQPYIVNRIPPSSILSTLRHVAEFILRDTNERAWYVIAHDGKIKSQRADRIGYVARGETRPLRGLQFQHLQPFLDR